MKIVLDGERPMSWNKLYKQGHWSKRKEEADRVHNLVWWALTEDLDLPYEPIRMARGRVDIHITAYFDKYPYDPDNICSKLYIDGLVGSVIENDTREFVRKVITQSEIDKDNPRVEIEINAVT